MIYDLKEQLLIFKNIIEFIKTVKDIIKDRILFINRDFRKSINKIKKVIITL